MADLERGQLKLVPLEPIGPRELASSIEIMRAKIRMLELRIEKLENQNGNR